MRCEGKCDAFQLAVCGRTVINCCSDDLPHGPLGEERETRLTRQPTEQVVACVASVPALPKVFTAPVDVEFDSVKMPKAVAASAATRKRTPVSFDSLHSEMGPPPEFFTYEGYDDSKQADSYTVQFE